MKEVPRGERSLMLMYANQRTGQRGKSEAAAGHKVLGAVLSRHGQRQRRATAVIR